LGAEIDRVVTACGAVVWDKLGGAWVYVRTGPEEFRRRRVELGQYLSDSVVIERGLNPGEVVVIVGAEALHGQEFKGDLQVEDED
jgi:multidrug efflux pump subunit AcrA (membrane-fusion protein)